MLAFPGVTGEMTVPFERVTVPGVFLGGGVALGAGGGGVVVVGGLVVVVGGLGGVVCGAVPRTGRPLTRTSG